ncbi:hypothetical protein D3C87_339570 [compost metagenome]
MSKFRLVVLDYTKEQLDNPVAQKLLSDMLFVKQKNFLRTDPNYVVMDKHDMIGTHYLIYDTTDFLNPKLIFAIRTTFLSRSKQHRIETPLMSLVSRMEDRLQAAFHGFHERHPSLVDCNAWFVDPAYSKKNSGLNLSDLGYFMVCTNLMRFGYNNFVGCTNESYNASRWLEHVGTMEKGLIFEHPAVKSPHMLILMEKFNTTHFAQVYSQYKTLIDEMTEVLPVTGERVTPLTQFVSALFTETVKQPENESAA